MTHRTITQAASGVIISVPVILWFPSPLSEPRDTPRINGDRPHNAGETPGPVGEVIFQGS